MLVVVTARGEELGSPVDPSFGRASNFILVDTESGDFRVLDNKQNKNAVQGAGVQAAQTVGDSGAAAVLTGHCGPKAFRALSAAGIKVYTGVSGTVENAVEAFKRGDFQAISRPDVDGHWQ